MRRHIQTQQLELLSPPPSPMTTCLAASVLSDVRQALQQLLLEVLDGDQRRGEDSDEQDFR